MRLYRCRYKDPKMSLSAVYHSEKSWEGRVCHEIKGMLELMGCTEVEIIPDDLIDLTKSESRSPRVNPLVEIRA